MGTAKRRSPASVDALNGASGGDHLGGLIYFDVTHNALELQAKRLARRFGLPIHTAAVVAELAGLGRRAA